MFQRDFSVVHLCTYFYSFIFFKSWPSLPECLSNQVRQVIIRTEVFGKKVDVTNKVFVHMRFIQLLLMTGVTVGVVNVFRLPIKELTLAPGKTQKDKDGAS